MEFTSKYEAIRKRFFDSFYYSGHVAEFIEGDRIKFAGQMIYMGQVLIFLASEVYIKRRINVDPSPSIDTIKEVLDAIDELDRVAEKPWGQPAGLNGFFVRDNIEGPDDACLKGRFTKVESDSQVPADQDTPRNAEPSGDQILGILYGLWFVVNLSEDEELIKRAKALSDRIYLYARDCKFVLKHPDGKPVKRGADMRWLSSLAHSLNYAITGIGRFDESTVVVFELGEYSVERRLDDVATLWDHVEDEAAVLLQPENAVRSIVSLF